MTNLGLATELTQRHFGDSEFNLKWSTRWRQQELCGCAYIIQKAHVQGEGPPSELAVSLRRLLLEDHLDVGAELVAFSCYRVPICVEHWSTGVETVH